VKTSFLLTIFTAMSLAAVPAVAQKKKAAKASDATAPVATAFKGDVTAVSVVGRVEQHPTAWRLWQPVIIRGERPRHLLVAYAAMAHGKKDMGDIVATLSTDDGATWGATVHIFNHQIRQGNVQFAYANPVLYRAPDTDIIWCFAMHCPIAQENSEESQLTAAFTADGGRSWTPVELAMHYTGPLITNGGIVETVIDGKRRFLLPAHRNTLASDPRGSRDHLVLSSSSLLNGNLRRSSRSPPRRVFSFTRATSPQAKRPANSRSSCARRITTIRRRPPTRHWPTRA
jgi:hypothetical protein